MKDLIKIIKALRKDLSIIFLVALLSVFTIDFWLVNIPEFFHGGNVLGSIAEKLCLSYMSAFIFYFLVVHIKQYNDKKNIYSYVAIKSNLIIGHGQEIARDLALFSKVPLKGTYPNKDELMEMCSKIDPYSQTRLLLSFGGQTANWYQFFENNRIQTLEAINDIYAKMPFLDTKLVNQLSKIQDAHIFSLAQAMARFPVKAKNDSLLNFASIIFDHLNNIKQFQDYYIKNIEKHK
jgi:hypothetical protein